MTSWCSSCRLQAKYLKPISENKDVVILSFDIQPEYSSIEDLKTFSEEYRKENWIFSFNKEVIKIFKINSLDTTIILDQNMREIFRDDGITKTEEIEEIISKLNQ